MGEKIGYELLWEMSQKERQTNELLLLPKNFYDEISVFIKELENATSDEQINMKRNAQRLLSELQERRKQKIIIYVAYKRSIPQPAIQEEEDLYSRILAAANGPNTAKTQATQANEKALKLLQPIPEIILPSGKKVGPFLKGQVIEIEERSDKEFLISNMICQKA